MRVRLAALAACVFVSGCGGGSSPAPSPTTPTPAAANRSPAITQLTVTPTFGVSQLSAFSAQASATDADGDPLTYEWELGDGTMASGASVSNKVYNGSGMATIKLTVRDGRGGSTTDSRDVTIGSMSGRWTVTIQDFPRLQMDLQQTAGIVTGTFIQLDNGFSTPAGTTGRTDPAEPGRIDSNGRVEIRLKVGRFIDFYMRGTMDATGKRIIGGLFGSGFSGDPFTAVKQ